MPRGGGVPRSAKEANNPILLKVQSLQLSFRPAGVSLGGGGGGQGPPWPPPAYAPGMDRPMPVPPLNFGNHYKHINIFAPPPPEKNLSRAPV